jgi:hypothetical protein
MGRVTLVGACIRPKHQLFLASLELAVSRFCPLWFLVSAQPSHSGADF